MQPLALLMVWTRMPGLFTCVKSGNVLHPHSGGQESFEERQSKWSDLVAQGLVFCVGLDSGIIKLYDVRSYDKGPFSTFVVGAPLCDEKL